MRISKNKVKTILIFIFSLVIISLLSLILFNYNVLNKEYFNLNDNIENMSETIGILESAIVDIEKQNEGLKEENNILKEQIGYLEEHSKALEEKSQQLEDKVETVVKKREIEKAEIIKLESINIPLSLDLKQYINNVSKESGIDPYVFYAIMFYESSFNHNATNVNKNGTTDSGICQINSSNRKWLSGLGFELDSIYGNIAAGAYVLRVNLENTNWDYSRALTGYNTGKTNYVNSYSKKVLKLSEQYKSV